MQTCKQKCRSSQVDSNTCVLCIINFISAAAQLQLAAVPAKPASSDHAAPARSRPLPQAARASLPQGWRRRRCHARTFPHPRRTQTVASRGGREGGRGGEQGAAAAGGGGPLLRRHSKAGIAGLERVHLLSSTAPGRRRQRGRTARPRRSPGVTSSVIQGRCQPARQCSGRPLAPGLQPARAGMQGLPALGASAAAAAGGM